MSKNNRGRVTAAAKSPVQSARVPGVRTALGAPGYLRDARGELFLLAATNLPVDERAYHEDRDGRVGRFHGLVRSQAAGDPDWTAGLLPWLRGPGNLRRAPVEAAADYCHARWKEQDPVRAETAGATMRKVVSSVLQRGDEPGEIIAYWLKNYGRRMPIGFKRGVADAVARLYTQRAMLRYDTPEAAIRFGDVIEIVNPRYVGSLWGTRQDDLFRYAIERRHGRDNSVSQRLDQVRAARQIFSLPVSERRGFLTGNGGAQAIADAGIKWESVAGWLQGPMDAEAWAACIPAMGHMALIRNLRNFDRAGLPDAVADRVAALICDEQEVLNGRQMPFRYLSAYRATSGSLRWGYPLEKALGFALGNVPVLDGYTLILTDRSPSMWDQKFSDRSDMVWADGAAVFAAALALRAAKADLVEFWGSSKQVDFSRGDSVLKLVERFSFQPPPGGTDIPRAVRDHLRGTHTRVVIITDEQTRAGWLPSNMYGHRCDGRANMAETKIDDMIPGTVPLYMWNFGGYRAGAAPGGITNRHVLAGLTDHSFRAIEILESGYDAGWPWEIAPREAAPGTMPGAHTVKPSMQKG